MKPIRRNKKIHFFASTSILCGFIYLMAVPGWWRDASMNEFTSWYPSFGGILYLTVNYFLPVYFILCISVLIALNFKQLYHLTSPVWGRTCRYLFKDVLGERRFVSVLFLRMLAFVYVIAFASVLWQFPLISETGLIPFKEYATVTFNHEGWISVIHYPSIFWINQSNWFLQLILIAACFISLIAVFGKHRPVYYFLLWFFYLSIVIFGRDLFHFPWDTFLLETGFLAIFASFWIRKTGQFPRFLLLAFCLLFFRQWFSMGMTKILWSDDAWYDLTYMKYFWLNQPSPTPFAWYMYQLPPVVQKILTLVVLVLEISIPVCMFSGRKGRILAFLLSLLLSFMIELNGNYGFFNLITAILGLWCTDDAFFRRHPQEVVFEAKRPFKWSEGIFSVIIFTVISLNLVYVVNLFVNKKGHGNFLSYYFFQAEESAGKGKSIPMEMGKFISRFRIVNPHGVFKGTRKARIHIQIQVKIKGYDWQDVTFHTGQDITDFSFSAPNMSRLAFNFYYQSYGIDARNQLKYINPNMAYLNSWMKNLVYGILDSNPETAKLMSYARKGKVEQVRILQKCLAILENEDSPFDLNNKENLMLDTVYIDPGDTFETPLFDFKNTADNCNSLLKH